MANSGLGRVSGGYNRHNNWGIRTKSEAEMSYGTAVCKRCGKQFNLPKFREHETEYCISCQVENEKGI